MAKSSGKCGKSSNFAVNSFFAPAPSSHPLPPASRLRAWRSRPTGFLTRQRWLPETGMWPNTANIAGRASPHSKEGIMAKTDFPLTIDRRRLLVSAAVLPAASVVSIGMPAGAATAGGIRSFATAPEAGAANVCSATATRLAEIVRRNALRNEFGLPLLSVATELRRMKTAADTGKVERFRNALRDRSFKKCLLGRGDNGETRLGDQKTDV